jgi:hypothetical protein
MSNKSAKWRSRQKAYEANQLHEWHTAQEAQAAQPKPAAQAPAPAPPDFSIRTPDGASWPADETGYSRFMKWVLPTNADRRGSY